MKLLILAGLALLSTTLAGLAAKPKANGSEPDALLRDLYKAHAAEKGPFFERKNPRLLERYFTKELARFLAKDAIKSEGEIGAIDFDPLYASQDPEISNLQVGPVQPRAAGKSANEAGAVVIANFRDGGKPRQLRFEFAMQPDKTWRISEIHYPEGSSLLQLLRAAHAH